MSLQTLKSSLVNPTYSGLAQLAHAGIAYSIIFTIGVVFGWKALAAASAIFLLYGVWKEFWFDPKYETPAVSGGEEGGEMDLTGYCIGILSALVMGTLIHFNIVRSTL